MTADFRTTFSGSIVSFEPVTSDAKVWAREAVQHDADAVAGRTFHADHRMALDIMDGIVEDGLSIQDTTTCNIRYRGVRR